MKWRNPAGLRKDSAAYSRSTVSSGSSRQCAMPYSAAMSLSSKHRSCSRPASGGRGAPANARSIASSVSCVRSATPAILTAAAAAPLRFPTVRQEHDFDWLVVGSGFGGSVAALRLSEKGHRVAVMECGRRFGDDDLPRSTWDLRRYFYAPRLGMRGIFRLSTFRDVAVVSGAAA